MCVRLCVWLCAPGLENGCKLTFRQSNLSISSAAPGTTPWDLLEFCHLSWSCSDGRAASANHISLDWQQSTGGACFVLNNHCVAREKFSVSAGKMMLVKFVFCHRTKAKNLNNFSIIFSWTKSWYVLVCSTAWCCRCRGRKFEFRHWLHPLHHLHPTVAIVTFPIAARHYSACSFLYVMCLIGSYVRCFEWGINK